MRSISQAVTHITLMYACTDTGFCKHCLVYVADFNFLSWKQSTLLPTSHTQTGSFWELQQRQNRPEYYSVYRPLRENQTEMNENVYANSGISTDNRSAASKDSYEDIYVNEAVPETQVTRCHKETTTSGTHTHIHVHTLYCTFTAIVYKSHFNSFFLNVTL